MKVYEAGSIRNVAVVGHGGAGKTQLLAAMLFSAGMVNRLGKVDEGNTVTDFDEEEIARKITLSSSLAFAEWNKTKINFIDTPGFANFIMDARAALRVVEAALVIVDAVHGVEVQTEKVWQFAEEYRLPRVIIASQLDRDRASFDRTIESLRGAFGRAIIPVQLPVGEERNFRGFVNLVTMKAYLYQADGIGKATEGDVPAELAEAAGSAREALVEMIAESDDALMERFFAEGTLDQEQIVAGLRLAVQQGKVFPIFCASGLANMGVQPLLDAIVTYLPSPAERGAVEGTDPKTRERASREPSSTAPYSAFVWKTIADPYAGRITMFRVYSGTLKADSTLYNVTKDLQERFGTITLLQGKTQTTVPEVQAGDLAAVAKLKDTQTSDTLADKVRPVLYAPLTFPEPVLSFAVEPKSRGDEEKISSALARLQEEDPTIRFSRDQQTKELLLAGQGQLHIEVTVARLKRRFGVDVELKPPKIPYRETIKEAVEAHGRHKKQTGGHGQFGDCKIRMAPLARGADFEFVDEIFGGAIPRNFIPAVEKGIQEARMKGFLAGYPVVDFRVELFDGGFHPVDSSELSFKIAGSLAFREAMQKARPTLLEPIMNVEIYVPEQYAGDVMGDLNSRRGRIQGMDSHGSTSIIRAQVPMAEMLTYELQLTSMTGGRGLYHMEYSHYDEVPAHLQVKIIASAKAAKEGVEVEEV